jgi:hypothetical protein
MESTNIRQIKAVLWDQAFIGNTWVSCPMGPVVAIRRRKGQLLAMICGWGRWYRVKSVRIEPAGRLHTCGSTSQTNTRCDLWRIPLWEMDWIAEKVR